MPDDSYRLPTGEFSVSATPSPTALSQPSETEPASSVSDLLLAIPSSESEDTSSLQGQLSSLRRRLEEQERMMRGIQSRYDSETARLRQQLKEQRRRAAEDIAPQLQSAGAEPAQIAAFRRSRAQGDEMEESREQTGPLQVPPAELAGSRDAQRYIRELCDAADVDPNDMRLDLCTPDAFRASLNQIKAERKKSTPIGPLWGEQRTQKEDGKPREKDRRSARQDLDVLGGGGGGAIHELPDDLDELWKLAKRETPSLRERP